jgi:hypothetical protein
VSAADLRARLSEALNDARSARALLGDRAALGASRLNLCIQRIERLIAELDERSRDGHE